MWTSFMDMHSGGATKEPPYQHLYIEAPEAEAKVIFYNRFGHNPERVTCTCCGSDYAIYEHRDLAQATGFERGCRAIQTPRLPNGLYANNDPVIVAGLWLEEGQEPPAGYGVEDPWCRKEYRTLDAYIAEPDVLVIRADEIKPDERRGEVPESGYVWVG